MSFLKSVISDARAGNKAEPGQRFVGGEQAPAYHTNPNTIVTGGSAGRSQSPRSSIERTGSPATASGLDAAPSIGAGFEPRTFTESHYHEKPVDTSEVTVRQTGKTNPAVTPAFNEVRKPEQTTYPGPTTSEIEAEGVTSKGEPADGAVQIEARLIEDTHPQKGTEVSTRYEQPVAEIESFDSQLEKQPKGGEPSAEVLPSRYSQIVPLVSDSQAPRFEQTAEQPGVYETVDEKLPQPTVSTSRPEQTRASREAKSVPPVSDKPDNFLPTGKQEITPPEPMPIAVDLASPEVAVKNARSTGQILQPHAERSIPTVAVERSIKTLPKIVEPAIPKVEKTRVISIDEQQKELKASSSKQAPEPTIKPQPVEPGRQLRQTQTQDQGSMNRAPDRHLPTRSNSVPQVAASPSVKIGQVDVFIDPAQRSKAKGSSLSRPSTSLSSRHYLRRL